MHCKLLPAFWAGFEGGSLGSTKAESLLAVDGSCIQHVCSKKFLGAQIKKQAPKSYNTKP